MLGQFPSRALALPILAISIVGCGSTGFNSTRTNWQQTYEAQPHASPAQETAVEPRSLPELLRRAELRNPELRAAFDRWTAALEQVPQSRSLPDPTVTYAYFLESVETRVGPQRQAFGIAQTIPLFGKLGIRGDVALSAANAAGARFESTRMDLNFDVVQRWNDYYFLHRSIAVTEENFRLMTYLEDVALAQYAAGKAPHSSVIRAQIELGRLEERLGSLQDQRRPVVAALNAQLSQPPHTPLAWPESLTYRPVSESPEELTSQLRSGNPRLAELRSMVEENTAAAKLAGRSPIPDLSIGVEFIDIEDVSPPGVSDAGNNATLAKASVSIPLWYGKHRAKKSQAVARRNASERELKHLENTLVAELEQVHFELRDAERRVELYDLTLLPKARQSLEVTEDAFTANDVTFLDLIDAQRTLLEFELAHERALTDRATKYAHLMTLLGRDGWADDSTEVIR